jgi:hypothetical protein
MGKTPRINNGPNTLCWCGLISNHVSGLCVAHLLERQLTHGTAADREYIEWLRRREEANDG